MTKVRTRFAPSPTGSMHIGNLRTAFYAYALAKHNDGDFILRIEDTDKKREIKGGVDEIKNLLETFKIKWDEYYIQSERLSFYKKAAEKLVDEGHAFYCECKAKNSKEEGFSKDLRDSCREKGLTSGAIKLKVPEGEKVSFTDFVLKKEVSWDTSTVGDATLLKSDGYPTYHLAVVVDDNDMKVSHVLRGHDWLPSTPIHLLVYKYLGFAVPEIGHLTDIMDPEGGKLSKRKGSTSVTGLIADGYLPEALFNFVILLGWAPKDNRELFTLPEFVEEFDPSGFQISNPIFNRDKLDWFNGQYIRQKSDGELLKLLKPFAPKGADEKKLKEVIPLIKDRIKKLSDFNELAGYVFKKSDEIDPLKITPDYTSHISASEAGLSMVRTWDIGSINEASTKVIKDNNFKTGDYYMDLRGTISGNKFTPPLNETLVPIGKDETINRLKKGLEKYKK